MRHPSARTPRTAASQDGVPCGKPQFVEEILMAETGNPILLDPELTFAFEVRVNVGERVRVGHHPSAELVFIPITGGTVSGRVNGEVLGGGGDWATVRASGVVELEARYLIRLDNGTPIDIVNRGFSIASPEVRARLDAGEVVPESDYYYRTSPVFRTDSADHRWLTETVFVGMARRDDSQVCIRFFSLS